MKVIVINDMDGHTTVTAGTANNLRKLLKSVLEAKPDEVQYHDSAKALIDGDDDIESLYKWMYENVDALNCRGGMIHVLEINQEWKYAYNPLM